MLETIKKEWTAKVALVSFLFLSLWWILLRLFSQPEDLSNQVFAAIYGLMALWGGIWGLTISYKWGGLKSVMGRAILMFSLALFAQEFGQLVYSYYIYFAKIDVPYPSIGDIGFWGYMPFYLYGILQVGKAAGAKINLKSIGSQIQAVVIPIALLSISYFVFLQGYEFDWENPLVIFLDFSYPLFQAFNVSVAFLIYSLSTGTLGGIMRPKIIFLLIAVLVQYIAEFTFLFQANRDAWFAGGVNDYIYLIAYFVMAMAIIQLKTVFDNLKGKSR